MSQMNNLGGQPMYGSYACQNNQSQSYSYAPQSTSSQSSFRAIASNNSQNSSSQSSTSNSNGGSLSTLLRRARKQPLNMQFHSSQSSNSNHSSQSSSTGSQRKNNSQSNNKGISNTNTSYTSNSLDGARWETVMTTLRSMNQVQKANEKLLRQLLETNVSLPLQKKANNDDEEQEAESTQPKQEPDPVVLQLSAKVTSMEELVTRLEKKLATQEKKMLESQNKQNKPLWSNDDHKDISKRRQEARHLVANGRKRRRRG